MSDILTNLILSLTPEDGSTIGNGVMTQRVQLPACTVRGQWRFQRSGLDKWTVKQQAAVRAKAFEGGSSD
jgi:hypothetical protein